MDGSSCKRWTKRKYRKIGLPFKEPRSGHDVYLTIDNNIQKIAQTVIRQTVQALKAKGGNVHSDGPLKWQNTGHG